MKTTKTKAEIAAILYPWHKKSKACAERIEQLETLTGCLTEAQICVAIFELMDAYTRAVSGAIGFDLNTLMA